MLTKEENELLTNIEGDAPMGQMLRQYWVPALRSEALETDGDPVRVRLFGENFVAFRATNGKVGIFNEACPHRGVSLLLARNEDCALTCIFHGWKFDVNGKTVSIPTEPEETHDAVCEKVPLKSYPVKEAGSIVWVYLGKGPAPEFPFFEFTALPETHVWSMVAYTNCNWLQGVEATIDSAHVGILHQSTSPKKKSENDENDFQKARGNLAPKYKFDSKPYGYRAAALRDLGNNTSYLRVTEYVAPWYSFIPFAPEIDRSLIIAVPVDNHHTAQWYVFYHPERPTSFSEFRKTFPGLGEDPNNFYVPAGTYENRWKQDRKKLNEGHWTGVEALIFEDFIVEESMGPIVDRSKEFLNSADVFIGRVRRRLLKSVEQFRNGHLPFGPDLDINYKEICAIATTIPNDSDWRDAPDEQYKNSKLEETIQHNIAD